VRKILGYFTDIHYRSIEKAQGEAVVTSQYILTWLLGNKDFIFTELCDVEGVTSYFQDITFITALWLM